MGPLYLDQRDQKKLNKSKVRETDWYLTGARNNKT